MNEPGENLEEIGAATAGAIAPDDPVIADLLKRKAAGDKLTAAEYGKVGWWESKKRKLADFVRGNTNSDGGQVQPRPSIGNTPSLVPVAASEAAGNSLAAVAPDVGMVKRTSASLLTLASNITQRYAARSARQLAASDKQIDRLVRAAALPTDVKELMVEVSPDALAAMGVDPKKYPLTVLAGAVLMWQGNAWLAFDEIRAEIAAEKEKAAKEQAKAAEQPKPQCT